MADRYWVGGTASWDGTAGTKWATTSGGTGGASVPTSADAVFFDANSGTGTVTITSGNTGAQSINCTGFTGTLAGFLPINVAGSVTLVAGMTVTYSGTLTLSGTGTLTSAGKTLGPVTINGSGITVTLGDALNIGANTLAITTGTFNTANYNVTAASISSNNTNLRTITFGSSTITLSASSNATVGFASNTNLTFNAGTSQINLTADSGGISASSLTFNNVSFTSTAGTGARQISGSANVFNNISISGPASAGVAQLTIDGPQTINGTLSTTGTAGNRRVWFRSATYGLAQTLTINSAPSLTDADFRDIYVVGTAAPISGTRIGNLRGCSGITFSTPKTVYWNLAGAQNWSANGWAPASGGAPSTDNFPLAQDTAVFDNTGSVTGTITMDSAVPYTGTVDMSGRTSAMTLSIGTFTVYGDWKNGSGTTLPGTGTLTFSGRNTQTITSAGKAFNGGVTVDTYGGSVELADALDISPSFSVLTITNGAFDTKNYNVSAGSLATANSNVRSITLGSSTVTLALGPSFASSTNLTLSAGTSQINITGAGVTFNGGGLTFYNLTFTSTAGGFNNIINSANTFNSVTVSAPSGVGIIALILGANQTITGTLAVAGATSVRRIFVRSDTLGTQRTLSVGTLSATDCDFRDIAITGAAAGSSPTRAGDCGGNSGITFPAAKTVYWNLAGAQNWSATGWATSSGGAPAINNFPLAQDTAVFDNTGSVTGTITIDRAWNIGTFDASARTSAMTFDVGSVTFNVHKDWKWGIGVTNTLGFGTVAFLGRGTQTITSNGVSFNTQLQFDTVSGTVLLADALSQADRLAQQISGTFDAATYNVTLGAFTTSSMTSALGATLKMGTGTWTLFGANYPTQLWSMSTLSNFIFYKGSANIVLSNNSTTSRTFDGASLSYNKLTIGGATGINTTTINGNNQFTELASTKTVAHTIALGSTTQTFGKWTVTGTAGNVVTLTGTGAFHILAGACTTGIDYLAMGSIGFSNISPGEFYAGPNSTGTAGAPVYRTAKPADSTRYWVGGTGNWSDTARWSTSSGGASGASIPRSHDDVVFDSASSAAAYVATVNAVTGGVRCKQLNISGPASGNLTINSNSAVPLFIHGNATFAATGVVSTNMSGGLVLTGSTTGNTFTTNGVALTANTDVIQINGVGCGWSLGSAANLGINAGIRVVNGDFNTAGYNVTAAYLISSTTHKRSITLGASTFTMSGFSTGIDFGTTENQRADLVFSAGTSQLNHDSISTFNGNNQTFNNFSFTSTAVGSISIRGANTFNNLFFSGITSAGLKVVTLAANQTVTGTLTFSAGTDATMRYFCRSDTAGVARTITAAAVSMTNVDFRDITIAGAAAPASGTRIGDCKGNSGITFTAASNKYWNLAGGGNWSSVGWATTSGGTPAANNFPLAQDTCIFEATGLNSGATITIDQGYNLGTINMSARTSNTMTLACSTSAQMVGNWINGTGSVLSGVGTIIFSGRSVQTITSAGVTFAYSCTVDSIGGSVVLQDSLAINRTLSINVGTFDANGYNVTLPLSNVETSVSTTRTIAVGSGTWTLGSSGTVWNASTSTNLTVTGSGTISLTSASAKTFNGGGIAYTNITLNQGGGGALTITGNNTFKTISSTASVANTISLGGNTQRLTTSWTASGSAGNVLTVTGSSPSSPATLVFTGGGTAANVDYLTVTNVRAYNPTSTWYAGTNSTNNGSLGWIFASGGGGGTTYNVSFSDAASSADAVSAASLSFSLSFSDAANAIDATASGGAFGVSFSDSARGSDLTASAAAFSVFFEDSARGADVMSPALIYNVAFLDLVTAADATAGAVGAFNLAFSDAVRVQDTSAVAISALNVTLSENAAIVDSIGAGFTFNVSLSESGRITDLVASSFLWNPIDDSQTPNWQNVVTAPPTVWVDITTTQDPNWVEIQT